MRLATTLVTVAALTGLGACSSSGGGSANASGGESCPVDRVPIVVSVDQWADIVGQLAGPCGDVTTIVSGSSIDPHDFEPTPADSAKFADAELVMVNGLDYDPWANKAIDAAGRHPVTVDAGAVAGLSAGANPHVWYSPGDVVQVADAVTAALKQVRPDGASGFDQWHESFMTSLQPYWDAIADARAVAQETSYGATESVFEYMAAAVGMRNLTPPGYQTAAANESEPAPGDLHAFEQALSDGIMGVLVYNIQTEGAVPAQIRKAAESAAVPVVEVTETTAAGAHGFVDWQVGQLHQLSDALRRTA